MIVFVIYTNSQVVLLEKIKTFLFLLNLQHKEFEILRFVGAEKGRMVGRLRFDFNCAHTASTLFCGFNEHFFKEWESHIVRARRGDEESAVSHEFHSEDVYIFVATICVFHFVCALAERRGIEDDRVKLSAVRFESAKNFKHVVREGGNVFESIEGGVALNRFGGEA